MGEFYRLFFIVTCLIITGNTAFSQGENNIWAFGINAGLDFNSGQPKYVFTNSATSEGAATISDEDGSLLFYSDGSNVWNREHKIMPNGDSILGNHGGWARYGSATQGVVIVPFIGNPNKYYLFTLDCDEAIHQTYPGYLRYSIVDMSLDNGFGDVIPSEKNVTLDSGTSEKMAVAGGVGCYFWLLTHKYGSPEFKAFKIDATGISSTVSSFVTTIDSSLFTVNNEIYMGGEMKVSSDNKMIGLVCAGTRGPRIVELYSFNNMTGRIQNPLMIYIEENNYLYGVSFSPDNQLLYVPANNGVDDTSSPLWQFDLSLLPDIKSVRTSRTRVGPLSNWTGTRIGPDKKIYINGFNNNIVKCINNPNLKGNSCNVDTLNFNVPVDIHFQVGFGNNVISLKDISSENREITHDTFLCNTLEEYVSISAPDGFDSYIWSDGTYSQINEVKKDIASKIWVRSSNYCGEVTDTFHINHCTKCAFIPNAFSPNGDGINDWFGGFGEKTSTFEMIIYDRWGNLVFSTSNINHKWNGMHKASLCDIGTYFYYAKVKCENKEEFTLKGDFLLLR